MSTTPTTLTGADIERRRRALGWTREQLGRLMNYDRMTIYWHERRSLPKRPPVLAEYERVLGEAEKAKAQDDQNAQTTTV